MRIENQRSRYKKSMSYPKFSVGYLPYPMLLLKKEKRPCFMWKAEDPDPAGRHKPCGMTTNFKGVGPGLRPSGAPLRSGFTLIELLVVVLIIGILAAVALPQYQKAVAKARASEALSIMSSLKSSIEEYILANGTFPASYDVLSVIPSGSLTTWAVDNDEIQTLYYRFTLTNGTLDIGARRAELPNFIWGSSLSSNGIFTAGNIFCYYGKEDPKADLVDQICRSFSKNAKQDYGIGYTYKL